MTTSIPIRRRRWRSIRAGFAACLAALLSATILVCAGTIAASPAFASGSTITSVSFGGTSVAPTITINGSGFGNAPTGTPTGCETIPGDNDYVNDDLYISDNTKSWTAGEPGACIGFANLSYTNTYISFSLGALYGSYLSTDWQLDEGDNVSIYVAGAIANTTVDYPTTITAVKFSGSSSDPVVTIDGSDFGPTPPAEPKGCGGVSGDYDYFNDNLYMVDNSASWSAGEPGACIGFTNLSYTNTQISFSLGSLYGSISEWELHEFDSVTIHVGGATVSVAVVYGSKTGQATGVAGYFAMDQAPYTYVYGAWTVPTANCLVTPNSQDATSVMLDGIGSTTVEQVGTTTNCTDGTAGYSAFWYIAPPTNPADVIKTITVHAGDVMSAWVQYEDHGMYSLNITDLTEGTTFSTTQSLPEASNASAACLGAGGASLTDFGVVSMSCYIEAPSILPDRDPIGYDNVFSIWQSSTVAGSTVIAQTSPLAPNFANFTVTYH